MRKMSLERILHGLRQANSINYDMIQLGHAKLYLYQDDKINYKNIISKGNVEHKNIQQNFTSKREAIIIYKTSSKSKEC